MENSAQTGCEGAAEASDDVLIGQLIAHGLSGNEARVAALASTGLSNREIGALTGNQENTVKAYLYRAYRKLNLSNRVQLTLHLASLHNGSSDTVGC
jgi:DNA-binding CsgD family transcriptional regulator